MNKVTSRLSASFSIACLCLAVVGPVQAQDKSPKNKEAVSSTPSITKKPSTPVDINHATEKELIALPGVGPKMAKQIIAARPFKTVDDLKNVKGIGDKTFEKLKSHVVCNSTTK